MGFREKSHSRISISEKEFWVYEFSCKRVATFFNYPEYRRKKLNKFLIYSTSLT